jgi:hypothetical protein
MPILILSYNPLAIRVLFVVAAILVVLGFLFYSLHSQRVRKQAPPAPKLSPPQEAAAPQPKPSPSQETSKPQMFEHSVRPGSPIWREVLRFVLILLAFCVAAGLVVVVVPQSTIDRWSQNLRLRHPETLAQERISLLFLGDETKGKEFHIRGVVRNISTEPIEKLDATVRLYAPDGSQIETLIVRMDTEQIAPDATSSFHLVYPDYNGQFASYSVDFKLRQGDVLPYKDMRREG